MKHVKLSLFIMMITVLLVSAFVPLTNSMTSNELVHPTSPTSVLSYESHDYFYIVSDTELAAVAVAESWEGDGSPETPFLIQGYEINPMIEDIHIENTSLYFKILDCNITGALGGISLENVTNGVIQNCLFSDNQYGIFLRNVTGIDVIRCSMLVPDWGDSGVHMDTAIDCSIQNCVMQGATDTDAGIYGEYCEGITLFNNTIFEFDNHGIFFGGSYDIDILNNTIYLNEGAGMGPTCGIYLIEGELAYIAGNNITENANNGITISNVDNVTISENYIYHNYIHGVYVEGSDFCVIQDNYIAYSGEGITVTGTGCGISTFFADYCQIIGNEFWRNIMNHITVAFSDFCHISNNFLNESMNHGIELLITNNATVEENEIYRSYGESGGSACGIFVEESYDTALIHNTLRYNSENGITIQNSDDGKAIGNTIYDSEYNGLAVSSATGWIISHNVIYDNGGPGIYMGVPTQDNILYYNDIGWSGEFLVADEGFGNFWNYTGVGNWYSDYSGTGTYTISGASAEIDYYPSMSLYCGATSPSQYEVGTTGNAMTWNSSALNPGTYELLIDGVSQGNVTWDGGEIAADVDGLPVGVYNVTLIVYHVSGHWLANESTLTVVDTLAPTWTVTPADQILDYNTPLSYQLQASDPSGIASWAIDDTTNFTISSTGLLTNATFLVPGIYYVEITVTDVYSHSVSVTIMITVNEPVPPSDPTMLMLAVGGIGAVVIIALAVIVLKKKGS